MDETTPKPSVILANISRGQVGIQFMQGTIDSLIHRSIVSVLLSESGPYLDRGRNRVTAHARTVRESGQVDWDWLLFVDSDIEFDHTHVDTLLAPTLHPIYDPRAYPIISGVYHNPFDEAPVAGEPGYQDSPDPEMTDCGPVGIVGPVVYEWVKRRFPEMPDADAPIWAFQRLSRVALSTRAPVEESWNPPSLDTAPTPSPVTQVAAVGCGFLAIHHTVLDHFAATFDLPLPYFDEPVVNSVHLGEDLAFCHRAASLGYPVLVNRACVVLHHKTMKLA